MKATSVTGSDTVTTALDVKPEVKPEAKAEIPDAKYVVGCDVIQTRGGKIRKGKPIARGAVDDATFATFLKTGGIVRA